MSEKRIKTGIRITEHENELLEKAQLKLGGLSKNAVILVALHALYRKEGIE